MKIIMLKGLPASGKSTWARERQKEGGNFLVISKDEIRKMFGGYKPSREKEVLRIRNKLIEMGIQMRRNVIVDDTNLNPKHERHIAKMARELGAKFEVNDEFLKVSPDECIKRDLHRGEKAVGSEVIWDMYYRWIAPDPITKLNEEFDKPRCVIVDVDGTLALNLGGRSFYDLDKVHEDKADPFVSCIVDALYNYGVEISGDRYPRVIIVSGREDYSREATEGWLKQYGIPYDDIFMRRTGDTRDDAIVKEEIYKESIEPYYAVLGVIDDRPKVCNKGRGLGLRVAQVGNPYVWF